MPTIKVILFDADGMVIRSEMFSNILSRLYHIPLDKILPFFEKEFQLCLVGKSDIIKEIRPYLKKWRVKKTPPEILKIWFELENKTDQKMIKAIRKIQKQRILCILATNQEKRRTQFLLKNMKFADIFDMVFSSADIGFRKPDPGFYEYIFQKLGQKIRDLSKEEVLVFDDKEKNIKSASNYGFFSEIYSSFSKFREILKKQNILV